MSQLEQMILIELLPAGSQSGVAELAPESGLPTPEARWDEVLEVLNKLRDNGYVVSSVMSFGRMWKLTEAGAVRANFHRRNS